MCLPQNLGSSSGGMPGGLLNLLQQPQQPRVSDYDVGMARQVLGGAQGKASLSDFSPAYSLFKKRKPMGLLGDVF